MIAEFVQLIILHDHEKAKLVFNRYLNRTAAVVIIYRIRLDFYE